MKEKDPRTNLLPEFGNDFSYKLMTGIIISLSHLSNFTLTRYNLKMQSSKDSSTPVELNNHYLGIKKEWNSTGLVYQNVYGVKI